MNLHVKRLDTAALRRDPTGAPWTMQPWPVEAWRKRTLERRLPPTRARMSASHTGLRHSAETRAKIRAANYRRWHTQLATPTPDFDGSVEFLDENMTRRDLVYVLEHLRFPGREALGTLRLDRQVRDFLVRSIALGRR
jgi:hypothetical protein